MSPAAHLRRRAAFALIVTVSVTFQAGSGAGAPTQVRKDRTPPTVSISTPASGAIVSGVVAVAGTAADNQRVAKVTVEIDGGNAVLASGTTSWSAAIDTRTVADGLHTLSATAVDRAGNATRVTRGVTVANNPAPTQPPPSPSPSPSPSTATNRVVYPEGVTIQVDGASSWTPDQVYAILKANALELSAVGPTLTVFVQDTTPSSANMSAVCCSDDGRWYGYQSAIYLDARPGSVLNDQPDFIVAHEYGHVWSYYHYWISQNGDWASYLSARGLLGDARLDSSYAWSRSEIIADDYRLLFGTPDATSIGHLNPDIPDPRSVSGLRDFFLQYWAVKH